MCVAAWKLAVRASGLAILASHSTLGPMSDEPSLGLDPVPPKSGGTPYRVLARKYRPSDFTGLIGQ